MKAKFKLFLYLTLLWGVAGCSQILDEVPVSQVGSQYYNSLAGFEGGVNAVYTSMRSYYGAEVSTNLSVFGTDTYTNGSDGSYKYMNQYTASFGSNVSILTNLWNSLYSGINTANILIDLANTDGVTGLSEAAKNQRIAELKFLRAHAYFLLTQNWGNIAISVNGITNPTKDFTKATVAEVYAVILADLIAALPYLPTTVGNADYGRATQGACEHMLAKVYLTKATSEAAESTDFENAATYSSHVINNYSYALQSDYALVHDQSNQQNSEIIWAVQYSNDVLTNGSGNMTHLFFLMEYDVQAGMIRDIANGRPWKRYRPTDYLLNVIFNPADRSKDSRFKKSFKDTWLSNSPGTFTSGLFDNTKTSVTFASGDTAIYIPGIEWTVEQRAAKKFQVLVPSLYQANLYPTLSKYLDPLRPEIGTSAGSRDVFVARLADTYLILAEANIKLGRSQQAADAINMIRRRAAWSGMESEMEITASDATMEFLMQERERELSGELSRWYDLKRWGVLVSQVQAYNPDGAAGIQSYHNLRPIPQTQIDRTEGTSTNFPQNPGY
ncbi:putative outer membrane starch-binding protein [Dyadobacter jejuensis]|uniref:Putative outer membrane starch-binding protein n=1 Tax=Dyadobacter jejuensis TaxID=1082580 RepID=A0A316ANY7_9BACT|nr:RagB/SusD family nutrient uptake outer membrane protein [Dyadobacter jejuensis]PWJ59413.1 putative outer membrane starch-binding protein [Dyadobacter jejuensis]